MQLTSDLGFDAVDAGMLAQARLLEPFALLWISLALKQGFGMHWGFKILKCTPNALTGVIKNENIKRT